MISVRGISFCIHCCLGLLLSTELCGAEQSYVWLTGDESFNIFSLDINRSVEEDFIWIFNTTIGRRINVSIKEFDFERGHVLITIGDGTERDGYNANFEDTSTYTQVARFSGSDPPSFVTSVSNAAWIRIRARRVYWKMDFNITVSSTNMSDIIELQEGETISLRSMNYPSNYPNNYYHLWDIRTHEGYVIEVIVRSFHVETGNDHVYIGDGVDSFTNQGSKWQDWTGLWENEVLESRDFTSSTNSITMIFTTDYSTTKSGFWIQLRAAKKSESGTASFAPSPASETTAKHFIVSSNLPPISPTAATTASAVATTTTTTSYASTTHKDPAPSTQSYIGPTDALIFKWGTIISSSIISSSILLLVILTCAVLKYKRWKQTTRNGTDTTTNGPESEPTGERIQESSTDPDSLPGRPYETIPEYLLAPSHSLATGHSNCPVSGPDINEQVDEFGYMIPDRDDVGELPDEQSPVSRDGYTDINHTYLDTTLSSSQQEYPHTYHTYESSMMMMKSFGEKDEQLSSHYYNTDSTDTSNRY
ncbi:uncharacterized protein LOC121431790 [Lytechinus variegatus]|uniref:uncharacterized protein LOC121431790 n=1 Tax=Lytechinus variegatus TaxID=7654 RepID=UPI001BB16DD6|nr:uncharacterized protein LOC121431790 [Lytechinus variegatus]